MPETATLKGPKDVKKLNEGHVFFHESPMLISQVLSALASLSPCHADRAKRLLTYGCPKETVIEICRMLESPAERDGRLTAEEVKFLPPMLPGTMSPMEKLQGELSHALRVIERMENREAWFTSRISQLEAHCRGVMAQLEEAMPAEGLSLDLGDTSLLDHERLAKKLHIGLLKEEGLEEGMTPTAPLLPIPTHSLKKAVSWDDLAPFDSDPLLRSMYVAGVFTCDTEMGIIDISTLPAEDYQAIRSEDFTCILPDGNLQSGWRMSMYKPSGSYFLELGPCSFPCMKEGHDGERTCQKQSVWQTSSPEKRTFWPTRLKDHSAWWTWMDGLTSKALKTLQGMDLEVLKQKMAEPEI